MKDDKYFWKYEMEPGLTLKKDYLKKQNDDTPLVSIITSYYNANEFMWQTINCVLNQTFPYWEWIIVDDGSTNKEAVEYLEKVEKIDERIKVYHKKNEGLAKGRDYAIKFSNSKYILPLDADDLIEKEYIETLYWVLETNKEASWAFTDSVGFGKYIYLVDYPFDSEKMKTENLITATALIRKEKILELDGYGVAKRYVNEDWHLWLRMLAKGDFPVQVSFYGFWYRRRKESLLTQINDDKNKENELRLRDLKIEADKIKKRVNAKIYPLAEAGKELEYCRFDWNKQLSKEKETILYIISDVQIDSKLYKELKSKSNEEDVVIIAMENTKYSQYTVRQRLENFAEIFNLPTFLDKKYFQGFIEYIIKSRNVKNAFVQNEYMNLEVLENTQKNEIRYKDSKTKYKLMIMRYKVQHTLIGRAIRKLIRKLKKA